MTVKNNLIKSVTGDLINLAPEIRGYLFEKFSSLKQKRIGRTDKIRPNRGIQDITNFADHKIGRLLIERIYKKYPKYIRVESEEESERIGDGRLILRFDPIDGSKHFKKGLPFFSSAIALVENNVTLFGMIIDIFSNNVYHASKNGGAYLNNKKIKVSKSKIGDDLSFVLYEAPNPKAYSDDSELYSTLNMKLTKLQLNSYRIRNIGLASLSVCYVSDGTCPAFIDFCGTTKLYDIEAALLIAGESGATIGNLRGKIVKSVKYNPYSSKKFIGENLVIANPISFAEIKKLFTNT